MYSLDVAWGCSVQSDLFTLLNEHIAEALNQKKNDYFAQ